MAKRVVDEASLTTVADAIRDSYGFKEKVDFPQGYVDMVDRATNCCRVLIEKINDTQFYFPKGLTTIGRYAFNDCQWVIIPGDLPEGIRDIKYQAFHNCFKIGRIVFPSTLERLENKTFENCIYLTNVTFKSKPTIEGTSFDLCSRLTTINVPWAEGEVAGAPWGATNATINYNYTGV